MLIKESNMKIVNIDRNFIVRCLAQKIFFEVLPEFNSIRHQSDNFKKILNNEVECKGCFENNVVIPTVNEFAMITIAMHKSGNKEFFERLKAFTLCYLDERNFQLCLKYQMDDNDPVVEVLI